MRSIKYLNGVLTVIAVLLTLNLWTIWTAGVPTGGPAVDLAQDAQAAPAGIPNAAAQRKEMIREMQAVNRSVAGLTAMFKSGQARVRVEGGKSID